MCCTCMYPYKHKHTYTNPHTHAHTHTLTHTYTHTQKYTRTHIHVLIRWYLRVKSVINIEPTAIRTKIILLCSFIVVHLSTLNIFLREYILFWVLFCEHTSQEAKFLVCMYWCVSTSLFVCACIACGCVQMGCVQMCILYQCRTQVYHDSKNRGHSCNHLANSPNIVTHLPLAPVQM